MGAAYFEALYAADEDPWDFTTSAYERAKYDRTVAALGDRRFARGLEVGCSIGVEAESSERAHVGHGRRVYQRESIPFLGRSSWCLV